MAHVPPPPPPSEDSLTDDEWVLMRLRQSQEGYEPSEPKGWSVWHYIAALAAVVILLALAVELSVIIGYAK